MIWPTRQPPPEIGSSAASYLILIVVVSMILLPTLVSWLGVMPIGITQP